MGCLCFPPCASTLVETVVSEDNTEKVEERRRDFFFSVRLDKVISLWCCKAISSANMLGYIPSAVPEAGLLEHLNGEAYSWLNSFAFIPIHYPDQPSKTKNFLSCRSQATWSRPDTKAYPQYYSCIPTLHKTDRYLNKWYAPEEMRTTCWIPGSLFLIC